LLVYIDQLSHKFSVASSSKSKRPDGLNSKGLMNMTTAYLKAESSYCDRIFSALSPELSLLLDVYFLLQKKLGLSSSAISISL